MQEINELFDELMGNHLTYRYTEARWKELGGKGQPFPSPTREVTASNGEKMIEELIQPVFKPIIIRQSEYQQLTSLAQTWQKFLEAQFAFYKLAKESKLPPHLNQLVRRMCTELEWYYASVDPGYPCISPFIRLDAVRTENGFKVIDINSTRPAGVGDQVVLSRAFSQRFGHEATSFPIGLTFCETVKNQANEWMAKYKINGNPSCCILIREQDGDWGNFFVLAQELNQYGIPCELIYPGTLDSAGNSFPILVRSRIKEGDPLFESIREGYPEKKCIMSPLYRRFLGNKLWMYIIREKQAKDFFSDYLKGDYAIIEKCFPQMGLVKGRTISLPDETLSLLDLDRKEWTIKQPASSSGRQMIIGYAMGKAKWDEYLRSHDLSGYIVQRFHRSQELLPVINAAGEIAEEKLFTKYGIYIFDGKLAGIEVMARRYPVVHGARDTYFSFCLVSTLF